MRKFTLVMFLTLSIGILAGCTGDNKTKVDVAKNEKNNIEETGKDISLQLDLPDTLEAKNEIDEAKRVSNQYKDIKKELDKEKENIKKEVNDTVVGHAEQVSGTLKELLNK
ncbi:hypothetical protein [Clostridium sp. Ade.TY]|uniref:hypothetical protein n=1 Tax=Clostridium sp. Ade.TY TaxID=1391647 RepID=UPI000415B017|nr:hypothetical protein [Clostridium sp. Ade.TY]